MPVLWVCKVHSKTHRTGVGCTIATGGVNCWDAIRSVQRQYLNHFLIQRVSAGELCFERALIVGFLVDATIVSPVDSNTSGDPPKVSNMVDWKGF